MAAIGSVWATGTWTDDVWADNTWANTTTGGSKLRRRVYDIEEPYNDDDDVFLIIKKIVLSGVLER